MKQPKHFFNLEATKNKSDEQLIFFNLSYGVRIYVKEIIKYTPLRISTQWSIKKEYWNDKPTYRANQIYVRKYGKDLNNYLDKVEKIGYDQLSYFRNTYDKEPTLDELKQLVLEKLNRLPKKTNDVGITEYITQSVETRTTLDIKHPRRWSDGTGKQYTNLKNHILKYEADKNIELTFGSLTGDIFMGFFKSLNEVHKEETGEFYAHNTIAKENKHFRALLTSAKNDDIEIGFNYSKPDYFIKRREIKNETFLTTTQLQTIINTDVSHSKELTHGKNYIILSSFTGLRIGDMVSLNEVNPEIQIYNSKKYNCITTRIRKSQENKDELIATIPLLAPIKEYLQLNDNRFPKFPAQTNIRKYVEKLLTHLKFENVVEIKRYYYTIDNVVLSKEKLCEIFTPHDCRSTFISNLKELGIHDEDIEPITHPKHKYTSIVQVYDKTAMVGKAVNLINQLKSKKSILFKY
ncbi:hypothetical protein SAMN05444372_101144 [Flavobacterium micromati]|uniref:Phage integrase SAM-like domain-containing protein n=1 Tax=Flavobacterium micromati TaxID=229205 RepID=A0A1M5FJ57_9FLAO|nr:phage integrase SAM-like domain-containing protein [Flavobacterium micromati]SHF91192.1 hypothetical protein SAMN05444372_101144 [Flavobacterium micromati]